MMEIYNTILYQPLFNAVILLYNLLPGTDFGLAIVALTLIVRSALFPLTVKTTVSQRSLNRLNPQLQALKEKFKNDTQAQSAAIMKLYKDNNVNPLSGCLPLLVQLPLLIALYQVFGAGFKSESLGLLYNFVENPGQINSLSFGFLDITLPSAVLALITGFLQFTQLRQNQALVQSSGQQKDIQTINKQMLYFFPVMIIIIGWNLPAGLLIYWLTTTLFSIGEQIYIRKKYKD